MSRVAGEAERAAINRLLVAGKVTAAEAQRTVWQLYDAHPEGASAMIAPDDPPQAGRWVPGREIPQAPLAYER